MPAFHLHRANPAPIFAVAALAALYLCHLEPAWSASGEARNPAMERLRAAQQRLEAERSKLRAENAKLTETLENALEQSRSSERRAATLQRALREREEALRAAQAERDELKRRLDTAEASLAQANAGFDDSRRALESCRVEHGQLVTRTSQDIDGLRTALANCETKNTALYRYGLELSRRYADKGVWAALRQAEPFTRIEQVEIENILEEYREKLDDNRVTGTATDRATSGSPVRP